MVGADVPGVHQSLAGQRAVGKRHQVARRLRFGNLERRRNGLNEKNKLKFND